ncbi:hypothetical protein DsansV1_C09g0094091 [Dioscorea sansibarensis]
MLMICFIVWINMSTAKRLAIALAIAEIYYVQRMLLLQVHMLHGLFCPLLAKIWVLLSLPLVMKVTSSQSISAKRHYRCEQLIN